MPYMLGIFGTIITVLFAILVNMAKAGFAEVRADVKEVKQIVGNHETRLQLVEAQTDTEEIAKHMIDILRASGSGNFDIRDFKR